MTKIRERYEKAKTLAERGATEGERQAAQAAMERMEAAHPELVAQNPDVHHVSEISIRYRCGWSWYGAGGTTTSNSATNVFVYYNVVA